MFTAHVLIVFLIVILVTSGSSKLKDRESFRLTLEGLGLSSTLAKIGVWTVPLVELLVAVLFLLKSTQWLAEIGLGLLVLSFAWSVYRAMSQKLSLSCNCFGNLTNESFGKLTIFRILLLALLDSYLLFIPSYSLFQAALPEWIASILFSVGCLMIYAVATTFYEFKQVWKNVTVKQ